MQPLRRIVAGESHPYDRLHDNASWQEVSRSPTRTLRPRRSLRVSNGPSDPSAQYQPGGSHRQPIPIRVRRFAVPAPAPSPHQDRSPDLQPRFWNCAAPALAPDTPQGHTESLFHRHRVRRDDRKQRSTTRPNRGSRHPVSHNDARTMTDYASVRSTASRPSAEPDLTDRQDRPQVGSVLRRARMHHQLSLRDVERRIGRSNAYLSQVERGKIKQPDPIVLLDLAELYGLNFETLATWALWVPADLDPADARPRDSTAVLVRQVMELDANERATVLRHIESILRQRRT